LFELIRNQLPKNAPASCFLFSLQSRKIDISDLPLSAYRVKDKDRLVLEFQDPKRMVQVIVGVEYSDSKFNFWVRKDATVKSVLKMIATHLRLTAEELRLICRGKELKEGTSFGEVESAQELTLRISDNSTPDSSLTPSQDQGLSIEVVCDDPSCPIYLQHHSIPMGVGSFELPTIKLSRELRCRACNKVVSSVEQLKFRECRVRYEGQREDGVEENGCESFSHVTGELMNGVRVNWRRLKLEVESL
jgi:hypothetical protein